MKPGAARSGFTLLEILLVVLVIAVVATAFVPMAVESIEGARLRSALRDTIALNRYARSKAILEQAPMAVLYHADTGRLQLIQLPPRREPAMETLVSAVPPGLNREDRSLPAAEEDLTVLKTRQLPRGVRIVEAEGAQREADTWFVLYLPSGMTDPHSVVLEDNRGDRSSLHVNGITGELRLASR